MMPALAWSAEDAFWFGVARRVLDAVSEQNSVVVSINRRHNALHLKEWCETLEGRYHCSLEVFEPVVSGGPAYGQVAQYLCERPPKGSVEQCVQAFMECNTWKPVLVLAQQLDVGEQQGLARMVAQWADCRRRAGVSGDSSLGLRFILALNCLAALPPEDIGLTIVRTYEHAVSGDLTDTWDQVLTAERGSAQRLWQTAVFPELAAYDPTLPYDHPWAQVVSGAGLSEALKAVAQQQGWDALEPSVERLVKRFPSPGSTTDAPMGSLVNDDWMRLWEYGLCGRVAGRGWDLHGALLAVHRSPDDLRQRVWRGQVRLIRPLIDVVRRRIELVVRGAMDKVQFEKALAPLIARDGQGNDDPTTAIPELDDLADIACEARVSEKLPCRPEQMRACQRTVRNRLAHGHVVGVEDLSYLTDLLHATTQRERTSHAAAPWASHMA